MKSCTRCGEIKPLDQFPPRRRGESRLQSWCRACFAANNARYYLEHHAVQKARLLRNKVALREENHRRALEYLAGHPCVDCGEADVVVLQFDHLRDKESNVSALINSGTWASVEQEIAKCDVRCANCHRLRTAEAWLELDAPGAAVIAPTLSASPLIQLHLEDIVLRECRVCRQGKPLSAFPLRSRAKQTRQWICLECQREYSRLWYGLNRTRSIAAAGKRNRERRRTAREMLRGVRVACVDCGITNPRLLDFDHLWDKRANVSYMVHAGMALQTIAREVDKCAIRCANCHARKTAREQGSYRLEA